MKLSLAELNYNLGHVLHQQGNLAGAVAAFQQAIALDPSFIQARHCLAVVLSDQGQDQTAAQHYRWILQRQPSAVKARHNLGVILARQAQPDAALACFHQLLQLEPNSPAAHTGCGLAHLALKQFAQALAHFAQALQPNRQPVLAFCTWTTELAGQDELTLARQACGQFLLALLTHSAQAVGDSSFSRVRPQQGEVGSDRPAIALHSFALPLASPLALEPNQTDLRQIQQHLGETCLHLGNLLMRYGGDGQIRQAEAYYQQALQYQPHRLVLYLKLADCLVRQQRWNAAILLCRLGLTLHPNAAPLHQRLGWLLEQQQQWSEAISCYRQAWQLVGWEAAPDPHSPDLHSPAGSLDTANLTRLPSLSGDTASDTASYTTSDTTGPTPSHIASITQVCSALAWARQNCGGYLPLEVGVNQTLPAPVNSPHCWEPAVTSASASASASLIQESKDTRAELQADLQIDLQAELQVDPTVADAQKPACAACQGLNCPACLQEIVNQFSPTQLQPGVYACKADRLKVKSPTYFIAQIPAGIAQITPYQTPWLVANALAVLTPERLLLADLSREYPGQLPTCRCEPVFSRILKTGVGEPTPIAGRVAVLAGLSGHNYFHWMVDILPRLELLRQSGWAAPDWFWMNSSALSFQRETLEVLGIPESRLLPADQWPCIQAEQLIAPAFAGHLGWPEPWALAWLRQQFLPLVDSGSAQQPERIYISRNRAHHRRLLNEAAVLERLQPLGFVAVELESMALAEQIALFAQAKVIVAPHGGGLTNTIFCQPGTAIVELVAPNYIRPYYWVISHHLGLHHYYVKGEPSPCPPIHQLMYPSPLLEDIWVDLERVTGLLRQLGLT